ncbi:MAG: hypothetical protein HY927_09240 [Elusimicrobia bacterium]|nr:hypothetical protein [Elusimicrobiota bacterium]
MIDSSFLPPNHVELGARATFHPSGHLAHFGLYRDGACRACLDLGDGDETGVYREGIAGEEYIRGQVAGMGPFASTDPRAARESFADWVRRQVRRVLAAG